MELKDTITLMTSDDYKDRFKAEYLQLKLRRDKLHRSIIKLTAGKTDDTPSVGLDLLQLQEQHMSNYLQCLEVRSVLEDIDID